MLRPEEPTPNKMPSVVIRPKALEDLAEIWAYIAEDSPRQAAAFAAAIDREIRDLARHPLIGRARPELLIDLRSLPLAATLSSTCRANAESRSCVCSTARAI